MEGDHDVTHRIAEDGDQDIGHILIHKSMKRLYPAETILVDERHFCFVRAVVNDTLDGVRNPLLVMIRTSFMNVLIC